MGETATQSDVAAEPIAGGRVSAFWLLLALVIGASIAGNTLLKIGSAAPDFVAQLLDWRTLVGRPRCST